MGCQQIGKPDTNAVARARLDCNLAFKWVSLSINLSVAISHLPLRRSQENWSINHALRTIFFFFLVGFSKRKGMFVSSFPFTYA